MSGAWKNIVSKELALICPLWLISGSGNGQLSVCLLHLYTPSRQLCLQTPKCSEYYPSEQSPVDSALSLTRLQLSGTNSLFLSAILPLSALLNLP